MFFFSGGHFNPAVTLGVTLAGALSPVLAVGYFISQLVGAVLGAAFVRVSLELFHLSYDITHESSLVELNMQTT